MGDPKGFLKYKRQAASYRPVCERVKDYNPVFTRRSNKESQEQASRCMDCGTPFCHWGCPIGSCIPEWNDLVFTGQWRKAFELLDQANNFPEITARICPAQCEYACVLGINDDPVTIRENELAIVEHAFEMGFIRLHLPHTRTGKKAAIIGSGPTGLSCASQLNKAGHEVTVFERDDRAGGLLRYGIPDFKLEKWVVDRRVNILADEGIKFRTGVNVGDDYSVSKLLKNFDAICLAGGSRIPRDLNIEGRESKGIYFAMDYLVQANRRAAGETIPRNKLIDAGGKKVLVIGGGDTGSDCVGTANRQGASGIVQIELLPKPPECRTAEYPWPSYPMVLKTSTSHEEGAVERKWSVLTKKFIGKSGTVKKMLCAQVEFSKPPGKTRSIMREIPGSEFEIEADLVILAIGFIGPEKKGIIEELGLALDGRGNIQTDSSFMASRKGVFSAGDMRKGQSLAAWAISDGRRAAHYIDSYLMGSTRLP
ncbi:MAG: glutamate synthase subunit beta [Candidatus Omnitrophota bacterium]|nr:glutamate synthase subunit beta [Candidatus Omnitrophota bacterium]